MKKIKGIIPWVLLIGCVVYYFSIADPEIKKLEDENKLRKSLVDSARIKADYFETRADSLQQLRQEVIVQIKEIENEQTQNHEKFKKDINRFVILADTDSLLLTGRALSDSINRIGYAGIDPY